MESEQIEQQQEQQPVRKVLIATPAHDGRLDVWYATSVINAVRLCQANGVFLHPIFLSYDALVQRARNDCFRLAVEEGYDDLIFIDSDIEFDPEWILELIQSEKDVIGGTYRKKTDDQEMYTVNLQDLTDHEGLLKANGIGTGFMRMSRAAFTAAWENSIPYQNEGKEGRLVCDIQVIDGQLVSEDIVLCLKLRQAGFDIWLDPKMTCTHLGTKKFIGNFPDFIKRVKQQQSAPTPRKRTSRRKKKK